MDKWAPVAVEVCVKQKAFIITSVIMICGYISLKVEWIVCCHGYLIYRLTSDYERVKLMLLSLFFSHGSSECIKIQNQRLYEIGGNIGKDSLTFLLLNSLVTAKEIWYYYKVYFINFLDINSKSVNFWFFNLMWKQYDFPKIFSEFKCEYFSLYRIDFWIF